MLHKAAWRVAAALAPFHPARPISTPRLPAPGSFGDISRNCEFTPTTGGGVWQGGSWYRALISFVLFQTKKWVALALTK